MDDLPFAFWIDFHKPDVAGAALGRSVVWMVRRSTFGYANDRAKRRGHNYVVTHTKNDAIQDR
jgi:hypothetical protein